MNRVFGDVLRQHTRAERITDPANETFVTLRLNGNGAAKRNVGEGKTPQPFSGYRVRAGQFIYSRIDARNGAFAIIPSSLNGAVVSKDFPVFDIDRSIVDPRFLLLSVGNESFVDRIRRLSWGYKPSASQRRSLSQIAFGTSAPNKQRRIAAILDKADDLRTKRREALAHLDALTQSIFHSMFAEPNLPFTTLGAIADFRYGSSNKSGSDGHQCLRIPNVARRQIDWTDMKLVSVSETELSRLKLRPGDLLFVRSNGNPDFVGRSAVFEPRDEEDVIYASYLIRARFLEDSPLIPLFVHAYLGTAGGREQLRSGAKTSAGQFNINTQSLGALNIPVPPLNFQRTFATRVAAVERLKESHRTHLAELDALFASLQHRAFKGEL